MTEETDYALIGLMLMFAVVIFFFGALAGWEGFKLTHNVVCWEEIGRCVAAPWS